MSHTWKEVSREREVSGCPVVTTQACASCGMSKLGPLSEHGAYGFYCYGFDGAVVDERKDDPPCAPGTLATLGLMVRVSGTGMVDVQARAAVVGASTPLEELERLFGWVREHVRKAPIMGPEHLKVPILTFADGAGGVDDVAVLLAAMARSLGHGVRLRAVCPVAAGRYDHVYAVLGRRDGDRRERWLAADPFHFERLGDEVPPERLHGSSLDVTVCEIGGGA